ncbi:hypothetical protein [Pseudomonas sp. R32]|uniref:hypothetical protein n=1 Tax=Pseudomonas sp. R32 TaxID=1573704 RepID=UPI0013314964|nr:hypothetical protein [Pseudomonas sp. R32]
MKVSLADITFMRVTIDAPSMARAHMAEHCFSPLHTGVGWTLWSSMSGFFGGTAQPETNDIANAARAT